MTCAGYVLRHLTARPLRATLTAGAFAFSIGLLGFLWLLSAALEKEWSPFMAQRVIVTAKTSFFDKLPMAYLPRIEAKPGVARVVPFDFVPAYFRDSRPENIVPVSSAPPGPMLEVYREADVPPEQAAAWTADPTGALIGPLLVEKFGWKVGQRIVLKAPVKGGVIETTVRAVGYRLDSGLYIHRRRGETAVLRVLGFRRRAIAGLLLGEALVYGLVGALLGGGVMAAFAHFVGAALDKTQYAGMGGLLVPDATSLLLAAAVSTFLAVLAGLAPALNLARRPIAALLREGA